MFSIIDYKNKDLWDKIVYSFNDYDVYYLNDYLKPFIEFEESKGLLIYYKNNSCEICYPIQLNDIAYSKPFCNVLEKNTFFDTTTPYGYGGPLVKNYDKKDIEEFFKELYDWAKENNIVSQFFRFHPLLENHKYFEGFCDEKTFKQTVYIDLADEETIYKNMNDKCRNMVKKAQKNELTVKIDNSKEAQETFKNLYKETMQKNNAGNFYYFNDMFFENLFKDLGKDSNLFSAVYQGNVASCTLIYETNKFLHYHLSAANREYSKFGANNLLLYEVAKYGASKGFQKLHLGGGINAEDGLFIFKKSFNRNGLVDFYIGRNIFDREKYNYLLNLRKELDPEFNINTSYMIGYRA